MTNVDPGRRSQPISWSEELGIGPARAPIAMVLEGAVDAVCVLDNQLRYTYANPRYLDLVAPLGVSREQLLGRVVWEVFPSTASGPVRDALDRALRERTPVHYVQRSTALGGAAFEVRVVPGQEGVVVFMHDVTAREDALELLRVAEREAQERAQLLEQQAAELEAQTEEAQSLTEELATSTEHLQNALMEAEEARELAERAQREAALSENRARRLLAVASGLGRAVTPEQVADVIFRETLDALGADAGSLALVRQDDAGAEFEVVRTAGYSPVFTEAYRRFPMHAGRPLSDALLTGRPTIVRSIADWERDYPTTAAGMRELGYESFVAIPVMAEGVALAGISFSFRAPQAIDDGDRTFLATIGELCASALVRSRVFETERRERDRSETILRTIRDGFAAIDKDFRFVYLNAAGERLLGRSAADLLGRCVWEAMPEAIDSPIVMAMRRVMADQEPETIEAHSMAARRWIEAHLYPAPDGLTVLFSDVSARRRGEEIAGFLDEASRLLGSSLDYETTLAQLARAAVPHLADWCAVDVLADPLADEWPPNVQRVAVEHADPARLAIAQRLIREYPTDWSRDTGLAKVLRTGRPEFHPVVGDEMVVAGARDPEHLAILRTLQFSSIIMVPLAARGRTLGALTLAMAESGRRYDESDLALAQELARRASLAIDNARLYRTAERGRVEAEHARREAEQSNQVKSEFLASMSHELRTPLNAIAGYAELIELGVHGPVTDPQRVALERIRRSQRHLLGLINDILNYAKLEAGRVHYELSTFPASDALRDLEGLVAGQAQQRGLSLAVSPGEPGLLVRADREKLQQILLNLVSNGMKATAAGGSLAVRAEAIGDAVRFVVTDSGIGIPADKFDAIFEPFVQLERAHSTQREGTGLGLAISRDLARGMGGDITLRSTLGAGSAFSLTLPRA